MIYANLDDHQLARVEIALATLCTQLEQIGATDSLEYMVFRGDLEAVTEMIKRRVAA